MPVRLPFRIGLRNGVRAHGGHLWRHHVANAPPAGRGIEGGRRGSLQFGIRRMPVEIRAVAIHFKEQIRDRIEGRLQPAARLAGLRLALRPFGDILRGPHAPDCATGGVTFDFGNLPHPPHPRTDENAVLVVEHGPARQRGIPRLLHALSVVGMHA